MNGPVLEIRRRCAENSGFLPFPGQGKRCSGAVCQKTFGHLLSRQAGEPLRTVDLDRYRSGGFDHRVFAGSFPSRMSAAFSAIAMTAALVLPRTIEGIT